MRLTMKERRRIAEATAGRYRRAQKKEKTAILNEFVEVSGVARSYAALVLGNHGRVGQVNPQLRGRGDVGKKLRRAGRRPGSGEAVVKVVVKGWRGIGLRCSK